MIIYYRSKFALKNLLYFLDLNRCLGITGLLCSGNAQLKIIKAWPKEGGRRTVTPPLCTPIYAPTFFCEHTCTWHSFHKKKIWWCHLEGYFWINMFFKTDQWCFNTQFYFDKKSCIHHALGLAILSKYPIKDASIIDTGCPINLVRSARHDSN